MTDFRTVVNQNLSSDTLDLHHRVLTLGSCFAATMGKKLEEQKINTLTNPFGTTYNPHSIHKLLLYAIQNETELAQGFIQQDDVYLHYDFHSAFSSLREIDLKDKILDALSSTHVFLKNTNWVILTYGTAWVYKRNDTNEIVANCHKMPANQFTKSLLHQDKIVSSFKQAYEALKKNNPACRIILTVSPVRHIKDTLELNCVSKAVLRLACHEITSSHDDVSYFPSYEIMMDDLRDYRFYKSDLIHPSEMAEHYIWEKFIHRYANSELKKFLKEWQEISAALNHRPFHVASIPHQKFLKELLRRLEALEGIINVQLEKKLIEDQLIY